METLCSQAHELYAVMQLQEWLHPDTSSMAFPSINVVLKMV